MSGEVDCDDGFVTCETRWGGYLRSDPDPTRACHGRLNAGAMETEGKNRVGHGGRLFLLHHRLADTRDGLSLLGLLLPAPLLANGAAGKVNGPGDSCWLHNFRFSPDESSSNATIRIEGGSSEGLPILSPSNIAHAWGIATGHSIGSELVSCGSENTEPPVGRPSETRPGTSANAVEVISGGFLRTVGAKSRRVIDQRPALGVRPTLVFDADPRHVWAKVFAGDISAGGLFNGWAAVGRSWPIPVFPLAYKHRWNANPGSQLVDHSASNEVFTYFHASNSSTMLARGQAAC